MTSIAASEAYRLTTLLLAQRDHQQTVGKTCRALQCVALLASVFRTIVGKALYRKRRLLA
jgi:hypothetical protein